jgi:hypothetical protein
MPPLLAALFMMALDCDLRIVKAIDLGMEWRRAWPGGFSARQCAECWYDNKIGHRGPLVQLGKVGTYSWPPNNRRQFVKRD